MLCNAACDSHAATRQVTTFGLVKVIRIRSHLPSLHNRIPNLNSPKPPHLFPLFTKIATTTEILIIGSGPTGLMLALELNMQKIPFRILDSTAIRSDKSRALVLHSRSLELLARHGIAQRFIERGRSNSGVRIFVNAKFVYEVDLLDL